jgi:hypothetical protein
MSGMGKSLGSEDDRTKILRQARDRAKHLAEDLGRHRLGLVQQPCPSIDGAVLAQGQAVLGDAADAAGRLLEQIDRVLRCDDAAAVPTPTSTTQGRT